MEQPAKDEVLSYFDSLSNWGRWGDQDELGTLNLISAEKRRRAASEVVVGSAVSCSRPIVREDPAADIPIPPLHFMLETGESEGSLSSSDFLGIAPHGYSVTHVDALAHQFWAGRMYNGRSASEVTARGATSCSVDAMHDGVFTRGVVLDIPALKGKPYLEPGEAVFSDDLEAAERAQGVVVEEGDALLLRTGWYRRRLEVGPPNLARPRPGLHAQTLPWLRERGISILAADAANDVFPSGYEGLLWPVHSVGIVAMGLAMIDNCQFEDLLELCHQAGRWSFLFVAAPLRLAGGTGAPLSPLAVF
jgi:kynurenine formamidase